MSKDILVGRQPIYNQKLDVVAYELLFRSSHSSQAADFDDGDKATSQLILNSFLDFGLDNLVGQLPAFINLTRNFLLGNHVMPFDKDRVVLEILEDIEFDNDVVVAIRSLSEQGYTIALDDFIFGESHSKVFPYINIIKIDILDMDNQQIEQQLQKLSAFSGKLLAEKIETQEEFEFCKTLGFDYYQGFFLSKPKTISRQRIPTNRLAILNLMTKLYNEDVSIKEMEEQIATDMSLSYRLMRYINSSYFGLQTKIESVNHALLLLGMDNIRHWVSLIALSGISDKPNYIITTSLIRAKMCSALAEKKEVENTDQYFTAGLFSNLPALLDMPIDDIIHDMSLAEPIRDALLSRNGQIGIVLQCCIDYEQVLWDQLDNSGLESKTINECYLEAISWANEVRQEIQQ